MIKKRIGILGGTFDPIHLGHLLLAEQVKEALRLEKIVFVPTHIPPHKKLKFLAPARERLRMVSLAIKSNPSFAVSNIELRRGGISYSLQTLKQFKAKFKHAALYFIVGSDFLEEFSVWKDIDELSKICKFVIASRPGYLFATVPRRTARAEFNNFLKNMLVIRITALDISSTEIRQRIKSGKAIRYLVPEEVRKYILKKNLYHAKITRPSLISGLDGRF